MGLRACLHCAHCMTNAVILTLFFKQFMKTGVICRFSLELGRMLHLRHDPPAQRPPKFPS